MCNVLALRYIYFKTKAYNIFHEKKYFSTLERSFLALDWDPDLKKRYFDENAAEVSFTSSGPSLPSSCDSWELALLLS